MSFIFIKERDVKEVVREWGFRNAPYTSLNKLLCFQAQLFASSSDIAAASKS